MRLTARPRLYWTLQLIGWGLYGAFGLALVSLFGNFSAGLVLIEAIVAGVLLLASHGLRQYVRRAGWAGLSPGALLPRLLLAHAGLAAVSIAVIRGLIVLSFSVLQLKTDGQGSLLAQYAGYGLNIFFVFWVWSLLYFGLHYFDRYQTAEIDRWKLAAAAREAELQTLQAQLNPHFLFNGLNNIRALVMEDPARARVMMTHLAELLRYSMQRNGAELVPLATELDIVENYLQLEALQLEDRLRYCLRVDPAARASRLPPMTLQLLVENAIKHGLAPRPAGGTLAVAASLCPAGGLRLSVRNTGTFAPPAQPTGLGLRNVRERLALLFGPAAHLRIGPDPDQPDTVLAEISLPGGS